MKRNIKGIMALAILAIFGFSTIAFGGWGNGYGHMRGPGWQGGDYDDNLSAEEIETLNQQRAEYLKATEGMRQQLYEKHMALQNELGRENPDTGNASRLQSEISKLQGDIDQIRLDFEIEVRKSSPNYGRGYRGNGPMMGYGPRGGGHCMW